MSVESTSSTSPVARVLADAKQRDAQNQRVQAAQPVFELPELSPKHRQSAQAKGDTGAALNQASERYNGDGLSDEQFLRTDARELSAGERQARSRETELPAKVDKQPATPQSEDKPVMSHKAEKPTRIFTEEAFLADAEKVADSGKVVEEASAAQALERPAGQAASKPVNDGLTPEQQALGTLTAMTDPSMVQAPVQTHAPQTRESLDESLRLRFQTAGQQSSFQSEPSSSLRTGSPLDARQDGSSTRQDTGRGGDEQRQSAQESRSDTRQADTATESRAPVSGDRATSSIQGGSQTPGSQSPVQAEIVSNIMRQIERMREQGRSALQVNIPLPDGQEIKMTLRMSEQRVQVKLDAQSEALLEEIQSGWAELSERAARAGVRLDAPLFHDQDHSLSVEGSLNHIV